MLWLQGEQSAPELIRLNFRRWASLNPGHELRILNGDDADRLLAGFTLTSHQMTMQAWSNVVRTKLLLDHGGVWADATLFPTEPLDAWLPILRETPDFSHSNDQAPIARCRAGSSRRHPIIS